jgi:hypothetical protein
MYETKSVHHPLFFCQVKDVVMYVETTTIEVALFLYSYYFYVLVLVEENRSGSGCI